MPAPAPGAAAPAPGVPATATKATGTLSFETVNGPLDMQVAGAVALWSPAEHRLRVLLTSERLEPALQQQLLGYLRDERLADSGRQYGILELQFRPDTTTLDRSSLTSASLTVAGAGGNVLSTVDVLSSVQWTGRVQPSPGGDPTAQQLELATAGNAQSPGANAQRQKWELSLAVPVVQAFQP